MPLNPCLCMISSEHKEDQNSCLRWCWKMYAFEISLTCSLKGDLFFYPKINQKGICKVMLKREKNLVSSSSVPRMEAHLNYMFI